MTGGIYRWDGTSWKLIHGTGSPTIFTPPTPVLSPAWKVAYLEGQGSGTPPVPGTTTSTLFGTSAGRHTGESWDQAATRINAAVGPNHVWRYFDSGAPTQSWPPTPYLAGKHTIYSFKLDPIQVPSGVYDTTIRNFFRNLPTNAHTWWTNHHECDVKVNNGQYTIAQWQASHRHLVDISREFPNPKVHATMILTGYAATSRLPQYYPGDSYVDALGWDPYRRTSTETGQQRFQEHYDLTRARNKQFLICETSDRNTTGAGDEAEKAEWVRTLGAYLDGKATAVTYFNSNPDAGVDWEIDNKPLAAAAYRELTSKTYVGSFT